MNLNTHVEIEPAHVSDVHALIPAMESTKERGLAPEESVILDSRYRSLGLGKRERLFFMVRKWPRQFTD